MKTFLGKLIPFFAGVTSLGIMSAGTADPTDIFLWIFRGFTTLCIAVIAYFLKGMIDDSKKANEKRDDKLDTLTKLTVAHEVMYQYWLETLTDNFHPEDGRRKTDKIYKVIQSLAENKNDS